MAILEQAQPSPDVVLAKTIVRAATQLGLKQADIAGALGVH